MLLEFSTEAAALEKIEEMKITEEKLAPKKQAGVKRKMRHTSLGIEEYPDASAMRDAICMDAKPRKKAEQTKRPTRDVEHPLQRLWPVNAFGRW